MGKEPVVVPRDKGAVGVSGPRVKEYKTIDVQKTKETDGNPRRREFESTGDDSLIKIN